MAFKEYFTHNFWAKLVSVLFATLLWLVLSFGKEGGPARHGFWLPSSHEKVFANLPVLVLQDFPDVFDQSFALDPTTVTITIKGSAMVVDDIQVDDIRPFVDLTQPGYNRSPEVATNKVYVYLPPSVSSVDLSVDPPSVRVGRQETDHDLE